MRKVCLLLLLFPFPLGIFGQSELPDLPVRNLQGGEVSFSSLVSNGDTAVIVSLWATWCVPCIQELEAIHDKYADLQKQHPFKLIAISVDDARTSSRVKPFVAGRGWPFDIYLDLNQDLKRALNINDIPHVLVIRQGRIVYQRNGYLPGSEEELFAQLDRERKDRMAGQLSGSFETITQFYQKDPKISAVLPADRMGSNNYLKLDYSYKEFTAGIQFESYLPSLPQFFDQFTILEESKLVNKYFKYQNKTFGVIVGNFHEQFGSGLVFRSWENRQIGINNALEGAAFYLQPLPFIHLKGIYGKPRKLFEQADGIIRGIDGTIDLTASGKKTRVSVGGSYVTRYQEYTGPDPDFPSTIKAGSARFEIAGPSTAINFEYVNKGSDPHLLNAYDKSSGQAILVNGNWTKKNIGLSLTYRGMKNMDFRGEREAIGSLLPVNFIPALTKQHDYLTTNIYVYNAQSLGETGGQAELFFLLPEGSALGGKSGSRLSINFSHYQGLNNDGNLFAGGGEKYFQDMSVEWKKKWSARFHSTLSLHKLFYNKSVIEGGNYPNINAAMIVWNSTYQYGSKKALRFELQHLFTKDDRGNWAAALAELSFAPKWIFFVSDLYNYDVTEVHYPTIGGVYTKGGARLGVTYGRQRAGLFCVGGVCRSVPATSGATVTLSTRF